MNQDRIGTLSLCPTFCTRVCFTSFRSRSVGVSSGTVCILFAFSWFAPVSMPAASPLDQIYIFKWIFGFCSLLCSLILLWSNYPNRFGLCGYKSNHPSVSSGTLSFKAVISPGLVPNPFISSTSFLLMMASITRSRSHFDIRMQQHATIPLASARISVHLGASWSVCFLKQIPSKYGLIKNPMSLLNISLWIPSLFCSAFKIPLEQHLKIREWSLISTFTKSKNIWAKLCKIGVMYQLLHLLNMEQKFIDFTIEGVNARTIFESPTFCA